MITTINFYKPKRPKLSKTFHRNRQKKISATKFYFLVSSQLKIKFPELPKKAKNDYSHKAQIIIKFYWNFQSSNFQTYNERFYYSVNEHLISFFLVCPHTEGGHNNHTYNPSRMNFGRPMEQKNISSRRSFAKWVFCFISKMITVEEWLLSTGDIFNYSKMFWQKCGVGGVR